MSHDEGRKGPALDDEQLLTKLRDLWSSHQRKDLEVRHAMGVLLNERLDDPNVRQEYGQQVIARLHELGAATVAASGASHVALAVARGLTVEASGASVVEYAGAPAVTKATSGASRVRQR